MSTNAERYEQSNQMGIEALSLYRSGLTYKEVGRKLGVGANRARQIVERAALREFRRSERSDRSWETFKVWQRERYKIV